MCCKATYLLPTIIAFFDPPVNEDGVDNLQQCHPQTAAALGDQFRRVVLTVPVARVAAAAHKQLQRHGEEEYAS